MVQTLTGGTTDDVEVVVDSMSTSSEMNFVAPLGDDSPYIIRDSTDGLINAWLVPNSVDRFDFESIRRHEMTKSGVDSLNEIEKLVFRIFLVQAYNGDRGSFVFDIIYNWDSGSWGTISRFTAGVFSNNIEVNNLLGDEFSKF